MGNRAPRGRVQLLACADGREEAERLFDNVYHLRQFLSGRTLWVGNTPVSQAYPLANYNCAFEVLDDYHAFHDLFYLLMVGSGVGVRVLKDDAAKLPKIRTNIQIIHKAYDPRPLDERLEFTNLTFSTDTATLSIGDSKEGWGAGAGSLLRPADEPRVQQAAQDHRGVRQHPPRGERLKVSAARPSRLRVDDGDAGQDS